MYCVLSIVPAGCYASGGLKSRVAHLIASDSRKSRHYARCSVNWIGKLITKRLSENAVVTGD